MRDDTPQPGSIWQERSGRIPPGCRRLVKVASADPPGGFVYAIGWWQERSGPDGPWKDITGLGSRRKTRIRTTLFLQRYDQIGEGQ